MNRPLTVAYIFSQYPRLTETFLHREVAGLRRAGLRVEIHALFAGLRHAAAASAAQAGPAARDGDTFRWWEAARLIVALPRELIRQPSLLRHGWQAWRRTRFRSAENLFASVWAVIYAVCRARRFRTNRPDIIHGVWATESSTAAMILSRLCDIPFSFGAHAFDIYKQGGDAFLDAKLAAAAFVHTTTQANVAYLRQRVPEANIILARRGLDRLPPVCRKERHDGATRILSVGRLASKKGHIHQLAACALLKQWGLSFEARIIGDGQLRRELQRQIDELGLAETVTLCGAQLQERVQEAYDWADIFWHTGVIDAQGDRDGLPNVIPEAFAHGLPVICGSVAGPLEAVRHEVTGLVVDVSDPVALATAVRRLAEDKSLRFRLGENGRRWVEVNFLIDKNAAALAEEFRSAKTRPATTRPLLLLTSEFAPFHGGIATYCGELARATQRLGHPVEVWTPQSSLPVSDEEFPFPVLRLCACGAWDWWFAHIPLTLQIFRHRRRLDGATVLLCDLPAQKAFMVLHGLGFVRSARLLCLLHGSELLYYEREPLWGKLAQRLFARADGLVAASRHVQSLVGNGRFSESSGKTTVAACAPSSAAQPRASSAPGPATDKIRVLTLARLHPRKGQLYTAKALALLPTELRRRIVYQIGGTGQRGYLRQIERVCRDAGVEFEYLGAIAPEALAATYAQCDIFAMTSRVLPRSVEGFGIAYLEAATHGKPAVGYRCGGVPEAVLDGQTGLLVAEGDLPALADAFQRLIQDVKLRRQLGDEARHHAARFSWETTAEKIWQFATAPSA